MWGKRIIWSKYFESKVSVYIVASLEWEDDESVSRSDICVLWEAKLISVSSVLFCVLAAEFTLGALSLDCTIGIKAIVVDTIDTVVVTRDTVVDTRDIVVDTRYTVAVTRDTVV